MSLRPCFISHFYAISKAALEHYTRNAAAVYASAGICVNAVRSGAVRTPMYEKIKAPKIADGFLEMARIATLQDRIGEPEEIAEIIAFLASNEKAR